MAPKPQLPGTAPYVCRNDCRCLPECLQLRNRKAGPEGGVGWSGGGGGPSHYATNILATAAIRSGVCVQEQLGVPDRAAFRGIASLRNAILPYPQVTTPTSLEPVKIGAKKSLFGAEHERLVMWRVGVSTSPSGQYWLMW